MSRVILDMAVSLDGFVAGRDGVDRATRLFLCSLSGQC